MKLYPHVRGPFTYWALPTPVEVTIRDASGNTHTEQGIAWDDRFAIGPLEIPRPADNEVMVS